MTDPDTATARRALKVAIRRLRSAEAEFQRTGSRSASRAAAAADTAVVAACNEYRAARATDDYHANRAALSAE